MKIKDLKVNQKTEFTRRCIGEAVIQMLQTTEFSKLKISDIVKRAGVSRTSFYNYYTDVYEVLTDYLNIIIAEYIIEGEKSNNNGFFEYHHIIFSFEFFDKYAEYFMTLTRHRLHSIVFEGINEFVLNYIKTDRDESMYRRYAYAGALLNSFLMWEEGGKKEPVEDIARNLEYIMSSN
ncbi:MAG: TetR/AcrR family transcriptional regulator [Lachnospiraceae bacterium]|nr:TetR/AcrR family transcriptional regulator [Lachnospiraceae bacterium]